MRSANPTPQRPASKAAPLALLAAVLALAGDPGACAAPPAAAGEAPVALVLALRGEALRSGAGVRGLVPLRLFDKLAVGAVIETSLGSEVRLLFAKGERYAIQAGSRVRIAGAEPVRQSGTVTALARLPAGLSLSPIAPGDDPGDRFPTIVVRAQPITGVYPRGFVTLPAGEAVLQFDPVPGTERYKVSVSEHKTGAQVFLVETAETNVALPPAALKPGSRYLWSVVTVGRIGPRAEGKGGFVTSTPEVESARAALDDALAGEPEGEALLLKATADLNLGRFREAYEELRRARDLDPQDQALKEAVELWRRRLELAKPAGGAGARPETPARPPGAQQG